MEAICLNFELLAQGSAEKAEAEEQLRQENDKSCSGRLRWKIYDQEVRG